MVLLPRLILLFSYTDIAAGFLSDKLWLLIGNYWLLIDSLLTPYLTPNWKESCKMSTLHYVHLLSMHFHGSAGYDMHMLYCIMLELDFHGKTSYGILDLINIVKNMKNCFSKRILWDLMKNLQACDMFTLHRNMQLEIKNTKKTNSFCGHCLIIQLF